MIGYLVFGGLLIVGLLYLGTSELAERINDNERKSEDNDDTNAV
jgi:hypothetical protein